MNPRIGVICFLLLCSVSAAYQDAPVPSPAPAQNPAPTTQSPAQPSPETPDPQEIQRQREDEQRQLRLAAREEEAARERAIRNIVGSDIVDMEKAVPHQIVEPCLSQVMPGDARFRIAQLPIREWLEEGETKDFPWKFRWGKPELRMDQRYQITYGGSVESSKLGWTEGTHEFIYVTGINDSAGNAILPPKARRVRLDIARADLKLRFDDCAFLQPGKYVLWVVVYDPISQKRNMARRQVQVPSLPDTLPRLNALMQAAEFPAKVNSNEDAPEPRPAPVLLEVATHRQFELTVAAVLTPRDQWGQRRDVVRSVNHNVLAGVGILSQLQYAGGTPAVEALDLVNRETAFRQPRLDLNDWPAFSDLFTRADEGETISIEALSALKERDVFAVNWLQRQLQQGSGNVEQVIILVSGSVMFERGSAMSPIPLTEDDCSCRVYHVRFRVSKEDVFDNLSSLFKPLRPRTFDVRSPKDFRNALSEIVGDLEDF